MSTFYKYLEKGSVISEAKAKGGSSGVNRIINAFIYLLKKKGIQLYGKTAANSTEMFTKAGGKYEGVSFLFNSYKNRIRISWFANSPDKVALVEIWLNGNITDSDVPKWDIDCSKLKKFDEKSLNDLVNIFMNRIGRNVSINESLFLEAVSEDDIDTFKKFIEDEEIEIGVKPQWSFGGLTLAFSKWHKKNKSYAALSNGKIGEIFKAANKDPRILGADIKPGTVVKTKEQSSEIKVTKGKPSKEQDSPERAAFLKKLEEKLQARGIETVIGADSQFERVAIYTEQLIRSNKVFAFFLAGDPGIGKTHTVTKVLTKKLGPEGKNWVKISGKVTPKGLYEELWKHNGPGKIILIDDADGVFGDKDKKELIKAATDTKAERKLSYKSSAIAVDNDPFAEEDKWRAQRMASHALDLSKDYEEREDLDEEAPERDLASLPKSFVFMAKVIVITNMYIADLPEAIISRGLSAEIKLTVEQTFDLMQSALGDIAKDKKVPIALVNEAFTFISDRKPNGQKLPEKDRLQIAEFADRVDFRTLIKVVEIFSFENITNERKYSWALDEVRKKESGEKRT